MIVPLDSLRPRAQRASQTNRPKAGPRDRIQKHLSSTYIGTCEAAWRVREWYLFRAEVFDNNFVDLNFNFLGDFFDNDFFNNNFIIDRYLLDFFKNIGVKYFQRHYDSRQV